MDLLVPLVWLNSWMDLSISSSDFKPARISSSINFCVLNHPLVKSDQYQPVLLGGSGRDTGVMGGIIGREIGTGVIRRGCPSNPGYGNVTLAGVEKLSDELNPLLIISPLFTSALNLSNCSLIRSSALSGRSEMLGSLKICAINYTGMEIGVLALVFSAVSTCGKDLDTS